MYDLLKQMGVQVIDENDPNDDDSNDDDSNNDNSNNNNSFDESSIEKRRKKSDGDYSDEWSDYDTW